MGVIRRQGSIGVIISYFGVGIGFISTATLIPKLLTPSQFGVINLLVAYATLFAQLSQLGMNNVTTRFFSYFRSSETKHAGFFRLILGVGIVGFVIFIAVFFFIHPIVIKNNQIDSPLFASFVYLVAPLTFCYLFFSLFDTYNKVLFRATTGLFLKEVLIRFFVLLLLIGYYLKAFDFNGFIHLYVYQNLIPVIIIVFILIKNRDVSLRKFSLPAQEVGLKREMYQVGIFGFISGASIILVSTIDRIMINYYIDSSSTGVYSMGFFFATLVQIPTRSIVKIASAVIAQAWKENDLVTIKGVNSKTALTQFILGAFIMCLLVLNIDEIISFIGIEYAQAKWVIVFVSAGNVINMATGANGTIIETSKYFRFHTYSTIFMGILVVVTNILFIPKFGVAGAAFASLLSMFGLNLARLIFVWVKMDIQPFTPKFLLVPLCVVIGATPVFILPSVENIYLSAILKSSVFLLLFASGILITRVSDDINQFIDSIVQKIRRFIHM